MDEISEIQVAKDSVRESEDLSTMNFYIVSNVSAAWQGPFESKEHATADSTISGHLVLVEVNAKLQGFFTRGS